MAHNAQKRLQKELMQLQKQPALDGSSVEIVGDSIMNWKCIITGPKDSPYEKGTFVLNFTFPKEYPFHPPAVKSETKVYHCNFDEQGNMCLDLLRKDGWSPMNSVRDVLVAISQLLVVPNPDHPLDEKIGEQFQRDKTAYLKQAKEWTKKYATHGAAK